MYRSWSADQPVDCIKAAPKGCHLDAFPDQYDSGLIHQITPSSKRNPNSIRETCSNAVIDRDLDLEGGEGKPPTTEIKVTNEDISKIIALLDDAKMLCVKTQNEFSPLKVRLEEPGPIVERPVHPGAIQIYWAGCKGLADLARRLASSATTASDKSAGLRIVSKIGLTQEKVEERLLVLGHDKYGSVHREDGREIARPGFERWVAQAIHVSREPRDSAIAITARTIDIVLPPGMTRRQLDLGLRKALAPFSLDTHGVECFTNYSGLDRLSRATELVIGPDPRAADFLLEIIEKILADHRKSMAHGASAAVPPQAHPPRVRRAKATSHRRRAK